MTKQQKRDYLYMRMARTWAENSYCVRRKVGALLVKDQMILFILFLKVITIFVLMSNP